MDYEISELPSIWSAILPLFIGGQKPEEQ